MKETHIVCLHYANHYQHVERDGPDPRAWEIVSERKIVEREKRGVDVQNWPSLEKKNKKKK